MRRFDLLVISALVGASSLSWGATPASFSSEDVFELEYANNPQISPDGERIVYERRSNDIMIDATRSNLWLLDVASGAHRPLVSGLDNASSPQWSADGTRIAWLQGTAQGTGIYVHWLASGQTALLTTLRESPSMLSWSPDGRWLAFVMPVRKETAALAKPPKKPEGAVWSEPVKTIDSITFRRDGQGFIEPAYEHVYLLPADGGN